jgi:four helix bundle protein
MERTGFQKLRVYQFSEDLSDSLWPLVNNWDYLAKNTVGTQLIRAADSIGANIAEGSGRGSQPEKKRFLKIARGSLFEVKHWLRRAYKRELISGKEIEKIQSIIDELTPKISAFINSIGRKD